MLQNDSTSKCWTLTLRKCKQQAGFLIQMEGFPDQDHTLKQNESWIITPMNQKCSYFNMLQTKAKIAGAVHSQTHYFLWKDKSLGTAASRMSTKRLCWGFWSCGRSHVVGSWPSLLAPQLLLYFLCYPGLQPWEKQHPEMCPFQLLNHTLTFFEEGRTHHFYKHPRNYIISNPFCFA